MNQAQSYRSIRRRDASPSLPGRFPGTAGRLRGILAGLLLAAAATGFAGASQPTAAGERPEDLQPFVQRLEREGIAIEVSLDPLDPGRRPGEFREGDEVRVRLAVTDTLSGAPMTTLYPAAWMDRLPEVELGEPDVGSCKEKVQNFVGGGLLAVPELDLNTYYVLALNDEASVSVVDPLFGFGGSKLLTTVLLESPGEDWELTRRQDRLFISLPRRNRVAVVDTAIWKVTGHADVGPVPTRLLLQEDEQYLWAAFEGGLDASGRTLASGVSVVDPRGLVEVARLTTGRGSHEIALAEGDRWAFVSNTEDGTVSVLDVARLAKVKDVPVGTEASSLAYSPIGHAVYVTDRKTGEIAVIDARHHGILARIQAEPGLGQIRFTPDGRWGLVVNTPESLIHIIDAATHRIVQTGQTDTGPDQVTFSDELAYLRHQGSDTVLMIPLALIGREGEPIPVVDFPGGEEPPGLTSMPSSAETIIQAPGAAAVLVANPMDGAIYYYKEGMAAPMGHFSNYGRMPRAVEVVDRSLREVEPGVYETMAQMRRPGRYDLAVFVDSPRVVSCFPVEVQENPRLARQRDRLPVAVALETSRTDAAVGEPVTVRLEVTDRVTGRPRADLRDVQVMTLLAPGVWHRRHPARALGEGVYEVEFAPPRSGVYYVFVEIPSQKLAFQEGPSTVLQVHAAKPGSEGVEPAELPSLEAVLEAARNGRTPDSSPR